MHWLMQLQQKKVEVVGTSSSMPLASMSVHTSLSAPVMSAKEGPRQTSTSSIVMCAGGMSSPSKCNQQSTWRSARITSNGKKVLSLSSWRVGQRCTSLKSPNLKRKCVPSKEVSLSMEIVQQSTPLPTSLRALEMSMPMLFERLEASLQSPGPSPWEESQETPESEGWSLSHSEVSSESCQSNYFLVVNVRSLFDTEKKNASVHGVDSSMVAADAVVTKDGLESGDPTTGKCVVVEATCAAATFTSLGKVPMTSSRVTVLKQPTLASVGVCVTPSW